MVEKHGGHNFKFSQSPDLTDAFTVVRCVFWVAWNWCVRPEGCHSPESSGGWISFSFFDFCSPSRCCLGKGEVGGSPSSAGGASEAPLSSSRLSTTNHTTCICSRSA